MDNTSNYSFSPGIIVDGATVYPKGYVWVIALALKGVKWAIEKANEPEFLKMIQEDLKKENDEKVKRELLRLEKKIKELREDLLL